MPKFRIFAFAAAFLFQFLPLLAFSQLLKSKEVFTRYDTLLGSLSPYRDYNVTHYDLNFDLNFDSKELHGVCQMDFKISHLMDTFQVDLFSRYKIYSVMVNSRRAKYYQDSNHMFIITSGLLNPKIENMIVIEYSGQPIAAKNAPWDGGFVWKKDSAGDHWIGVACEGLGASSWWPCKDHWSDEPDRGVDIHINVPIGYKAIANGRLISNQDLNGQSHWRWQVKNPINLYDVTLNIAKYEHFGLPYKSKVNGKNLDINYWVLRENLNKAKKQFQQVKPMMDCYESKFGQYPFYEDGYQLVETPYLGMEHQSCIAYGNKYKSGYLGATDYTGGHDFDYIIIHETGHEWFGNNISAADPADMWIHEALTTYAESIYVECIKGFDEGQIYIQKMKKRVRNRHPIQGNFGVAKEGDGDMYAKGAIFINVLRHQINNDDLWYMLLKDMGKVIGKKTTNYKEVVQFFNKSTNAKWDNLFSAYVQYSEIPILTITNSDLDGKKLVSLTLTHPVSDLEMRVYYEIDGKLAYTHCKHGQKADISMKQNSVFKLREDRGYFKVK